MQSNPLTAKLLKTQPAPRSRPLRRWQVMPLPSGGDVVLVTEGAVAIDVTRENREAFVVDVVSAADGILTCDELFSSDGSVVLRALVPSAYTTLPRSDVDKLTATDHEFARSLALVACRRERESRRRLMWVNATGVTSRVASALLFLDAKIAYHCPLSVGCVLQVSQSAVAGVAGVSRQTVNRELKRLEELGFVRRERAWICLLDRAGLELLAADKPLRYALAPCGPCQMVHPDAPLTCATPRRVRPPT